jgi:hypothetical protein
MIDKISEIKAPIDFVKNNASKNKNRKGNKSKRYFFSFFINAIVIGIIIIKKLAKLS